ncbi:MPK1 [Symbiodinium sp. CCMP2592]|nr:MPK1 [Symbiodinium sp. CCMP2592]
MQACCIHAHSKTFVHQVATKVYLAPDTPISQCLPYSIKHQHLFSGNVPQPADWLRAWRACRTASSFKGAVKFYSTEDFAAGRNTKLDSVSLKNMILVMHWAVKSVRKQRLEQATSISLSVDDRKEYRLVRYRCDVPPRTAKQSAAPGSQGPQGSQGSQGSEDGPLVADGLLGVYKTGASVPENTLEEHDADKSQVMADSIGIVIDRACQDPEGKTDEESCSRLKLHVRHFAADQCTSARKCGRLLVTGGQYPNLVWVSHDPAHQVRIAYQDPLHAMPEFQDQWERLFAPGKGKHALIPDIQNSEVWKARLMAAQQEVLRLHGSQAGVEKVIRALSFSQPRFDSSATPMLKYLCMIRAMAVLCAMQAADERNTVEIRSRAERALQNMNAAALMRCGLTCDYTSECLGFLRRNFDIEDPDVSCTPRVLEEFTKRQRFLFVDGYILSDSSQVPSSVDGSEAPGSQAPRRCATQLVYEEIQTPEPIFYGNRVHYLCTKAGISDVRQIMGTMAHVVEAMLERLRVDLTEDEIAVALQVFNLRLWQETNRQQELVDSTRKLCDMLKLSHGSLVFQRRGECEESLGHPGLSDTFWTFAKTVQLLKVEKVQDGEEQNLRYNNTLYNKAVHQAATAAVAVLRGPSGPVEKAARRLELEFGRGILSSQYSKLSKLLSLTNKLASATRNAVDLTAWMIDSLTLALRMNMVTPAKCTEKFLDRDRKTGDAGFWLSRMLVVQVFDYAAKLAKKLPEPDKVKLTGILAELRCPSTCWEKYLCHADADQGAAGEDDMDGEDPEDVERPVPQSKIGAVKEGFNKAIGMLLDLLLELMSGKYYKDCCMLASSEDGLAKALTAAQLGSSDDTEHEEPCARITQMKIIVDKFDNSTKSVGATSAAPAPSLLQSLAKAVQTERRKFVSFSVPNKISKDCLVKAFRGCGKVFTHKGTLNSSHRLIVASADLLAEAGTDPWLKGTPQSEEWKEICAFAKDISGPEDFVVLFDGRMREIRRVSEDLLLNQQHTEECTIVYSGGCPPRTGRTRRVPLAAKKVETGAVKFPVARTKIQTTKKGSFTVCGEASTYQGTYSGVEYRAVSEMPRVSADTKKKIIAPATTGDLPTPPEDWQDRHGSDVPLFWNESKPIAYWNAIIEEFCAEAVFDLTAGTGALMEASLTAGIAYHGLCSLNKEPMSWVQAVADRAACGMMALEGSTLYSDENAKAVKKHFPHVLESLSNQDDQDEAYQTPLGQNQSQDGFSSDAPGSLRKQAVKDGLVPKARRAFVIWFQENSEVKKGAPKHEFLNEMKHLGAVWQGMTDKQKAPFMARSKDEFMAQRSALAVLGIRMRGSTTSAGGPDEAKDPPAADESGGRVGPFELNCARAPIGGGAYGSVYSCQHPQSGLNVAVKVYRGPDGPADCRHEVEQMKLLMKAVPQQKMMWFPLLVSSGVTGRPWPWMATSLCGPSLATALRNPAAHGKPRTWSVAAQLRSALQTLHDAGILHLDVKPGNVLWCPCTDQVQVCDFGMSENMARLQKASQAPRFLQYVTAAYRPPELWPARVNGDGDCGVRKQLLTAAVDMWAYACVVFEVETGNPFMPKGEAGLRAWCKQWPELWKTRSDLANCPAASHTCCTKVLRAGKWGLFVLVGCAPDPGKRRWPELCLNQK